MAVILCIETATTNCSVALGKDEKLLALKEDYSNNYSHAERLHIFIEEILQENELSIQDVSAIAVSKGPGSYTGLRIGVSAAKGLCFSLDVPLIAIPTLDSLSRQVDRQAGEYIVPLLDARRMEVYTTVYDSNYKVLAETSAKILDETSFLEYLHKGKVTFIGNGVEKFQKVCDHENAQFIIGKLPSAAEMVEIATEKFKNGSFEDVAYFEPYYLKDFQAG